MCLEDDALQLPFHYSVALVLSLQIVANMVEDL